MKTWQKRALAALAALGLGLIAGQRKASAYSSSATVSIDVVIQANLSVEVSTDSSNFEASSTETFTWNTYLGSTPFTNNTSSTVYVLNDSGGQTEDWGLSTNANSIDVTGNNETWAVATSSISPGSNKFAVQAVFGSSDTAVGGGCPAAGAAIWANGAEAPLLTQNVQTYTDSMFTDSGLSAGSGKTAPDDTPSNNDMSANSERALCWQVVTPNTTTTAHEQNIQIIVTAQNPS